MRRVFGLLSLLAALPCAAMAQTQYVTQRPPVPTDDVTQNYAVGDFWNVPGTGEWVNKANKPGAALWQPYQLANPTPANAIGGVLPAGCWGTKTLVSGYAGPLVNVINPVSGAVADIGATPAGDIDRNALAMAQGTASYVLVDIVYDQCGDNNLTQMTTANMPVMTPLASLGNSLSIVFDGVIEGKIISKFFDIPTSLVVASGTATSQVAVASARDTAQNDPLTSLLNTTNPAYNENFGFVSSSSAFYATVLNTTIQLPVLAPVTPYVAGLVLPAAGGSTRIWLDNQTKSMKGEYAPAYAGGYVGKYAGANAIGGYTELSELLFYNRALSTADQATALGADYGYFGLTPQVRDVYVADGDSITEGYGTALNQTYPRQLMPLLTRPYRIYNTGAFGQFCVGPSGGKGRLFYLQTYLSRAFTAGSPHVQMFSEFCGTNEVNTGIAAAQTETDNASVISYVHNNFGAYVVDIDMLPRQGFLTTGNPTYESQRLAFNSWMTGGGSGANAVVDVASDPLMGSYTSVTNKKYYFDGTHPTELGATYEANDIAAVLNQH